MAIVLLSRRLPEPVMQEMVRRFTLIGNLEDRPMTRLELLNQVPEAEALAVTLAAVIGLATLIHVAIEVPTHNWGKRTALRWRRGAART